MANRTYYDRRRNRYISFRTGHSVCSCGRGYGSEYDGLCIRCRGGVTAYEAKQKALRQKR